MKPEYCCCNKLQDSFNYTAHARLLEKLRSYLADIDAVPDDINQNDRIDLILDEYTIWNKKYKNENTINSIIKQILNDNQSQTKRSEKNS